MHESVFTRLQLLPLFQGMSKEELLRMVERVKFNFVSAEDGEVVLEAGESATRLVYALNGVFKSNMKVNDGMVVEEVLEAPFLFQPERMFGRNPYWKSTLQAQSDVNLLLISKQDLLSHMLDFLTFRLSLLNYLCCLSDDVNYQPPSLGRSTVECALVGYLQRFLITAKGKKRFKVRMVDLAQLLGISRLCLSKSLNGLQGRGLLALKRGCIVVDDFKELLNAVQNPCK